MPTPRPPPLQQPAWAGLSALAGMDAWTGGGGPATELRGATSGVHGPVALWWGSSAELIGAVSGPVVLDDHSLGIEVSQGGVWSPSASVRLRGAGFAPWGSAEGVTGLARTLGRSWRVQGEVSAGGRVVVSDLAPQLGASIAVARSGRIGVLTRVGMTAWTLPLPPIAVRAEQWLTLGGRAQLEIGAAFTGVPVVSVPAVIGIPAPGAWVVQGLGAASMQATDRLAVRIEIAPEIGGGTVPYGRARALIGVDVSLGRRPAEAPEPGPLRGGTRFELRDPHADEVALVADFTDWEPLVMSREPGGWWALEVDVPPGRWAYGFRVDGAFVTPPAADAWEPDGFGGTNGVVIVAPDTQTAERDPQ